VDGAIRFMREGWPIIKTRVPGARLRIVGKDPPASLQRAADRIGVDVAANVPSMAEEMARATVFVVPLWVGAGVRVKIVEAIAARVPIAATRLAAEGLGIKANEHYAAGDTPGELGGQVATLLLTPELRRVFRERSRAIAEERWSLDAMADRQNALCAEVAR
jgi:glycosyltransferase involved in cell wall biosynthesis